MNTDGNQKKRPATGPTGSSATGPAGSPATSPATSPAGNLTKRQFDVLFCCHRESSPSQRIVAEETALSLGAVNATLRELQAAGLLTDSNALTLDGVSALQPYKVRNAVIMAAGMSLQFAPIAFERPKGVLKVRGEVLVERQIRQLQEAGIRDITVVVGYRKEEFFYLEDAFGVKIVVNEDYAKRNNHSTIHKVRDILGNTYICSSDNYFSTNPFEQFVYGAYYAAVYQSGPTREYCLKTKGADDLIVGVGFGGSGSWVMLGHAYWDERFARAFTEILERDYDHPDMEAKLWEDVYAEHVDELEMHMRKYPVDAIWEFESLDDVRGFDPLFLENVDSAIIANICSVLECDKSEIRDVYPLKQGLTNLSCHFTVDAGEFVYRHPGIGTEQMIDRSAEVQALELARSIGIDSTFVFEDPVSGWKISRFIRDCRELDPHDDAQLAEAMALARKLHGQTATLDRRFDYFEEGLKYERLLLAKGPIDIRGYDTLREQAVRVKQLADADGAPTCLTHNDFFSLNLLYDADGALSLIDWEYAGMSDYASDFGTFAVTCKLSREEAERALGHYFGRRPTAGELRHNFAYVGLAGWCWYVWSLQKESEGDNVGEWLYTYWQYAKEYLPLTLSLYEGEEREGEEREGEE